MKKLLPSSLFAFLCFAVVAISLTSCATFNDPYGTSPSYGGYGGGYNNNNNYDYDRHRDYERERYEEERRRLERERERLEDERRRHEQHRSCSAQLNRPPPVPPPPPVVQERCPSGFQPSERKCSPEERRRGCQDIRLSSGLGCVKR